MITLKNDSLSFNFPEIHEELRRRIEQHVNSTLPAIIAADRAHAVQALQSYWRFRDATSETRREAESRVMDATPEEIATVLRRKCMSAIDRRRSSVGTLELEFQRTLRIPDDG